jgi:hypothetical protein
MPLRLLDGKSSAFRARASFSIDASWKDRSARAGSRRAMRKVLEESKEKAAGLVCNMIAVNLRSK